MTYAQLQQWLAQRVVPLLPPAFRQGKMPYLFFFEALLTLVLLSFPLINPYHQAPMISFAFGVAMMLQMVLIIRNPSIPGICKSVINRSGLFLPIRISAS